MQPGSAMKIFRIQRGLRQIDLAEELCVSENYICKVETGRIQPPLDLISRIAEILSVDVEALYHKRSENRV